MPGNLAKILILAILLAAIPFTAMLMMDATSTLANSRPSRMTRRLMSEYQAAKSTFERDGDTEVYLAGLKKIDPSRTPRQVARAFSNLVLSVQTNPSAPKLPGDTNVLAAEAALRSAAARYKSR
jgi:hypothetical protein